eukprot:scaffold117977_cov75-Phaeocystis_antarctica.AAC.3
MHCAHCHSCSTSESAWAQGRARSRSKRSCLLASKPRGAGRSTLRAAIWHCRKMGSARRLNTSLGRSACSRERVHRSLPCSSKPSGADALAPAPAGHSHDTCGSYTQRCLRGRPSSVRSSGRAALLRVLPEHKLPEHAERKASPPELARQAHGEWHLPPRMQGPTAQQLDPEPQREADWAAARACDSGAVLAKLPL